MKSYIVLVAAMAVVGFDFAVANTALKQTDKDLILLSEGTSQDTLLNNSDKIQTNIETTKNSEIFLNKSNQATLEIEIEQQIPIEQFEFEPTIDNQLSSQNAYLDEIEDVPDTDNEFELVKEGDYYYNDVVKDPNEIMDTAAGFVPIPIFRKKQKQKPRRQQSNRRYNRRPYASRRKYHFYPYYRYYRPSSLRYFYY